MEVIHQLLIEQYYHYEGRLDDSQFTKPDSITDREWKEFLGKLS